ncbi:unnamed protein product [Schistosoma turkestanicum]|nr:unnamed protein product [Schistosoma turkestanicum]
MSITSHTSEGSSFSTWPHIIHSTLHITSITKHNKRWNKQSENKSCENNDDDSDEEHITDIILTFVLAVDSEMLINKESTVTRPKSFNSSSSSSSKGHNNFMYFHFEYAIMDKDNYSFSTDVVVFSKSIAKIYPTNCSSKLTNPCEINNTLWIVWTEQIPIVITDEMIIDFWNLTQTGGIRIKCWDQRDKCSIQTRFDRPRSVSNTINKQPEDNIKDDFKLSEIQSTITLLNSYCKSPTNVNLNNANIESVPGKSETTSQLKRKNIKNVKSSNQSCSSSSSRMKALSAGHGTRKIDKIQDLVDSWGSCCLVLQTGHLFRINPPGWIVARKPLIHTVNVSLNKPPLSSINLEVDSNFKDILVGMKLSNSLLSDKQWQKFQPIILTIDRLHNLPVTPYRNYEEMRNLCEPIRLVTTFSDVWNHQSREYVQDKEIYMDEVQVILTYNIPGLHLRELIQSLPIVIDVYDRVYYRSEKTDINQVPGVGLFCTEPDDDKIGKAQPNLKTTRFPTQTIDEKNITKISSPTGRVILDLSEIIRLKCVKMKQKLPVLPVSESDLDLLKDHACTNTDPRSTPRSYIGYMDYQCELSIEIEVNINMDKLLPINTLPSNVQIIERMVFIFEKPEKNETEVNYISEMIEKIKLFILKSNARSIGLSDELPVQMIKANLNSLQSQYMPCIHSRSSSLVSFNSIDNYTDQHNNTEQFQPVNQFITGFHLNDEDFNLIILETGDNEVSRYLENLIIESLNVYNENSNVYSSIENNNMKFLKNNMITFTKRLYTSLNWYLLENTMTIPMKQLIEQPIFYIRDLLPRLAYCAIHRIFNLRLHCNNLSSSVRANLFPTCHMIQALIKQFCISPILTNLNRSSTSLSAKSMPSLLNGTMNNDEQIIEDCTLNKNDAINRPKNLKQIQRKYLSKSCIASRNNTLQSQSLKDKKFYHSCLFDNKDNNFNEQFAYNYSIQSLNSSIISKNELYYNILSKNERYTYSNEYLNSGSFELTQDDCLNEQCIKQIILNGKSLSRLNLRLSCKHKKDKQWNKSTKLLDNIISKDVTFKVKVYPKMNQKSIC